MQLDEGSQGSVDLAFGAGLQDIELHPLRARRFLHVSHHALGNRIVRVHEQGDQRGLGNQLGEQLEPLRVQLGAENAESREVTARPRETGDQPAATGSPPPKKTIGIVEVALFAAEMTATAPLATITSTLRSTRLPASAGSRSYLPSAQRYSIATSFPTT